MYNQPPYGQPQQQPFQAQYINNDVSQGYPMGQPVQGGYQQQPMYAQPQYQPQNPQMYQPQQQPYGQTSVLYQQHQQVVVVQSSQGSADGHRFPTLMVCPYCQNQIQTQISHEVGDQTMLAGCLVLIVCWPLFWLPCVMQDCKDIVHHCPRCGKRLGVREYRMC